MAEPWMDAGKARQALADAERTRANRPPLSDDDLRLIATTPELRDDREVMGRLDSAERRRMARLVPAKQTWTDTAVDALPIVGGAVGGMLGAMTGIPTMGLTSAPAAITGAGILGAGGEAAKQLINRYRGKAAPGTITDAASDIALSGASNAAMEGGGQAIAAVGAPVARAVYRGFLKPSLAKNAVRKAGQITETALQEGIPITASGAAGAEDVIKTMNAQVKSLLAQSNGKVDLHTIANRVRAFAKTKYFKPGVPLEDYQAALKVADNIEMHPSLGIPPGAKPSRIDVSVSRANEIKGGIDDAIGGQNFGVERGATKTVQKFARRALRRDIEQQAGGATGAVAGLNARQSRLIDAAATINRAVAREESKNPLYGVTTLVAGAVGGAEYARTRDPYYATAKALALKAAMNPAVATRAAIVAYRLGSKSGAAVATVARAAVEAVSAGDDSGEEPAQDP